jgi:hypothetical protein
LLDARRRNTKPKARHPPGFLFFSVPSSCERTRVPQCAAEMPLAFPRIIDQPVVVLILDAHFCVPRSAATIAIAEAQEVDVGR